MSAAERMPDEPAYLGDAPPILAPADDDIVFIGRPRRAPVPGADAPILARLEGLPKARMVGGQWKACCPAHDDRTPSLGWTVAADGRVLVTCHAGCSTDAVMDALGATLADLFVPREATRPAKPAAGRVVRTRRFEVRDVDGGAWTHVRREDAAGRKVAISWEPSGGRLERLRPYGVEHLDTSDVVVVVVEGEATADAVCDAEFAAVGTFGTSYRPVPEALAELAGRRIVLWPDADKAGEAHMLDLAARLAPIASSVWWVTPPAGVHEGWDAGDADASTIADLVAAAAPREAGVAVLAGPRFRSARELAEATPERPSWLLGGCYARGAISEVDGPAKRAGKTTLVFYSVAAIVRGEPFLGLATQRTRVVILSEQPQASLREVLVRTGLDGSDDVRLLLWVEARGLSWPDVVAAAIAECQAFDAGLLVVDTLGQWAGIPGAAENDSGAALAAIGPLQDAAAAGLAVVLVRHDRKSGGEVGESARGSSAFTGAVDIVFQVTRDKDDPPTTRRRTISAVSRFDETPSEMVVELTDSGYVVLGEDPGAVAFAAARWSIRELLRDGVGRRRDAISAELTARGQAVKPTMRDAALASLVDAGEVRRDGAGVKGNPHVFGWVGPVSLILPDAPRQAAGEPEFHSPGFPPVGEAGNEKHSNDETGIISRAEPGETETVDCVDYLAHRGAAHRRDGSGWRCFTCHPDAEPEPLPEVPTW